MSQNYIIEYLSKHLAKSVMPNFRKVKLVQARLGNDAGILGAAHIAMKL